jgi:hypothetical protein
MSLRPFFAVFVLLAVLASCVFWYGGRLLTSRHTVARYTYRDPLITSSSPTSEVIRWGLTEAMAHSNIDPSLWVAMPGWDQTVLSGTTQVTGSFEPVLIILSNRNDGAILYARVEPTLETNTLQYHIYRPK